MSERVFPDRYGYWIAKTVLGNQVVFRVFGGNGISAVYTDLRGDIHPVEKFSGEWIASVADIQDRLAAAEADVSHARHVIHGTGQLGASLREEVELVAAALAQTRNMLSAAEAELAELKQRIAAAPVGWSLTADGDDEPWLVSMVHPVCETERRRTGGELRQVRLLEVRDGE